MSALNDFACGIENRWHEYYEEQWSSRRAASNNASQLGHPCTRFLYYLRTRGNERLRPSREVIQWMARGLLDEERVKIILMQLGYELTEAQRIMEWPAYEIAGRIDWNFIVDGKSYPCDCKSVSGHVMAKARREFGAGKIEDRTLRKYLVQVNLYCIMKSIDHGFFVFYSPEDHDIFVPVVELDYDLAEETLKKCEAVNAAMKGVGEPPALGDWDVCPRCDFFHLCSPELVGEEGADLSPELAERLNLILNERERMEGEIKGTVREIERLKKEEKEMVKERPLIMLRDWIVTGKLVKRAAQAATEFWGHWPRHK